MSTRRTSSRIASNGAPKPAAEEKVTSTKRKTEEEVKTPAAAAAAAAPKKTKKEEEAKEPAKEAESATAAPIAESKGGILAEGKPLPKVTLKDESGKEIDISQLKKAVLFTYPKANTPGCTTQACLFRDEYAEFQKIGFQVFGLSSDGETSLKNWKEKKGFKYSLLSDPKRELIGALTGTKSSTIRSHFVVDGNGKLAHSALKVKPADSSPSALKIAKGL